ncbi:RHS repeat-associated core domain-containing protein [Cellulomonas wangsupingiae]|uniref:RHS repeat-associated core domain-containing protein n=1 Tax=Cellulomonas wangsupingiae TaxID=2968085 RepID=UPI00202F35FA|nr:RHS repeat-associated core domain-containing protein [Cellulomonas wangsupingiae]MCM0638734.1 DUF6531 domain-containing protein [Cellulomonas wangsupingiae]
MDKTVFAAGEQVRLTAAPNQDPRKTDYTYALYFADQTTGRIIESCEVWSNDPLFATDNSCSFSTKFLTGDAHTYRAYIAKRDTTVANGALITALTDIQAVSNDVSAARQPWSVSLSADKTVFAAGEQVRLTAAPNQDPRKTDYTYALYFADQTTGRIIESCEVWSNDPLFATDNSCSFSFPAPAGASHVYRAYVAKRDTTVANGGLITALTDIQAVSNGFSAPNAGGPTLPGETRGGSNPSQDCSQRCHGDPVNSVTGEFWETAADLEVPDSGPGLSWSRSFATTRAGTAGSLGFGWSTNYDVRLTSQGGSGLSSASWIEVVQENGSTTTFTSDGVGGFTAPLRVFATLERLENGTYRFVRRGSQVFLFDQSGRLTRVEDRNGNGVDVAYDDTGRLHQLSDDDGRSLTITWSGSRIDGVTDSTGRVVSYTYSDAGDLTRVKLPDGSVKGYSYDTSHRVVSLTHPDGGITRNEYDSSSRVVAQKDPLGRVTTFAYAAGQTTVTDPSGMVTIEKYTDGQVTSETKGAGTRLAATTTFTYGPTNQVEVTTDPLGRVTRFTYDGRGNRTSVTDPLGRTSTTTYDAFNNPLVVMNAEGESTTFAYDERGNLLSMTDPTGAVTAFTVNQDGTVATATDPLGRVTTYAYDAHGFVASVTGPDGAVVTTVHDTLGRLTATTDPRGTAPGADDDDFTSTFTYDAAGRRLTATDPVGAVVASAYDAAGRPVSMTDAAGATTTSEYDLAGQVTAVVDATGARTAFTYDGAGRVTAVTDPSGATTTTTYDQLGRPTAVTDALGRVSRSEYDAGNRVTATVSPSGKRTTYTYDAADQLLTVTDPLGKVTTTTYDRAGRPVTVTDADGRAVTTSYDRAGRPVKVLRADGSALRWEYDAAGKVTATIDAAGARTTYTYDAAGRRATATDTAGRTTTFGYDPAGLLTTLTQADGAVTTYTYDAAGRRTGTDYSDATPDASTVYDVAGRPARVTDATGTTTYDYDVLGRVLEVANGATSVGYAWDALGRLTELTYPTGQAVQREYDAVGQLTTVTDWADREYTYTYDVDGLTEQIAYPNGVTTGFDRDDNGQTMAVTTTGNGIDLLELAYGYTDAGLLADQGTTRSTQSRAPPTTPSTSSTYAWDDLARISQITGDHAGTFDFDAAGSVTALADGRTLTYDTARQLTTLLTPTTTPDAVPVTTGYTYDGRGNRATATTDTGPTAGTVTHAYNQANQLTSITGADSSTTTYTYAATGLRATATTGATTEQYTWDTLAGIPLLLTDATFAYVYGNGSVPLAQVDLTDGGIDYLHTDTLGSVRSTTDATGAVTSDADYDPYGRPEAPTSDPTAQVTRFGYAGEYTDPTGYLYLRARYYDPESAQFLTRDPLEATTGNPYGYTDGNPLQFTDPLGLDWLQNVSDFAAAFGDRVSFGGTRWVREQLGVDGVVNYCSTAYNSGGYGGAAVEVALALTGIGGLAKGAVGGIKNAVQLSARQADTAVGTAVVRYDANFALGQLTANGRATASQLDDFGAAQGWVRTQTATGPVKFVDENGVVRLTIKGGSDRAPGSALPHVEMRNASGQRVDSLGTPVTRKSPGNHTPITWDW